MSDAHDDLEFRPMHSDRRPLLLGLAVLALGAGAVVLVQSRLAANRQATQLARAADARNDLQHCLLGGAPAPGERASTRARRTELAVLADAQRAEHRADTRAWPRRCAAPASVLTHALFEADSDRPEHRLLAMVASRAASFLERGDLQTANTDRLGYLDELFEAARRAGLPAGRPPQGPPPPTPANPLQVRTLRALVRGPGAGEVVARDTVSAADAHLVLGRSARALCTFGQRTTAGAAMATARCVSVPAGDAPAQVALMPTEPGTDPLVRIAAPEAIAPHGAMLAPDPPPTRTYAVDASAGFGLRDHRVIAVAAGSAPDTWRWLISRGSTLADPGATVALPVLQGRARYGPAPIDSHLVLIAASESAPRSNGADAAATGSADAASPRRNAELYLATMRATGPSPFVRAAGVSLPADANAVSYCRAGTALVAAVRGDGGRVAIVFADPHGNATSPGDVLAPGAVLTCAVGQATLTWTELSPVRLLRQARCTATACVQTQAPLPDFDGVVPRVAPVGDRILAVASPGPGHGLRLRLGPLAELYRYDERVVFDDAAHGGLDLVGVPVVVTLGDRAVIVVSSAQAPFESYALDLDAGGRITPIVPSRPPP